MESHYKDTEISLLTSSPEVPEYRRAFYALGGLAGMRADEAAGLRWGDFNGAMLRIRRQYGGLTSKTGEAERTVPVSPELARLLREWRNGWTERNGRGPVEGDHVVPDALKRGAMRSRLLRKDCEAVGIPNKGFRGLRRFFFFAKFKKQS
jgi:integrase